MLCITNQQCGVQETGPSPRRGHAVEVVSGQYIVFQGGYDGQKHLADAYILDTQLCRWLHVDIHGMWEQHKGIGMHCVHAPCVQKKQTVFACSPIPF